MNSDEKIENNLAPEPDGREGDVDEPAIVVMERAEEERHDEQAADGTPKTEQGDAADDEPAREPEAGKRGGRPRADASKLKPIIEALIFVSEQPISLDKMAGVLPDCPRKKLKELLAELVQDYEERRGALEIVEVANGYQFRTRAEFAPWLGKLRKQKFARLSRAALETLAIVAYRQPATRAEAESIRGVDSGAVLGTLLDRGLLRILGRKEVPGRPILYGTTQEFLELFGLKSLKDLPTLSEIKDMVETSEEEAATGEGGGGEGAEETWQEEGAAGAAPQGEGESAEAGAGASPATGEEEEDEEEYEDDDEDDAGEEEWSRDEGPLGEEEMTTLELDEILKSTKTRLEIYEGDMEEEEEAGRAEPAAGERSPAEPAPGENGTEKAGEGDNPDES